VVGRADDGWRVDCIKAKRKVIQLMVSDKTTLYALCNDGTMWMVNFKGELEEISPITVNK